MHEARQTHDIRLFETELFTKQLEAEALRPVFAKHGLDGHRDVYTVTLRFVETVLCDQINSLEDKVRLVDDVLAEAAEYQKGCGSSFNFVYDRERLSPSGVDADTSWEITAAMFTGMVYPYE